LYVFVSYEFWGLLTHRDKNMQNNPQNS
jgi:hypothetical protein